VKEAELLKIQSAAVSIEPTPAVTYFHLQGGEVVGFDLLVALAKEHRQQEQRMRLDRLIPEREARLERRPSHVFLWHILHRRIKL
jgi:hypothetical protein